MAFHKPYTFFLTCCICVMVTSTADARRLEKRWIQSTGFGGSEQTEYKRAVANRQQQVVESQEDNKVGLFPIFPGDEDEFEQEVQDKDKLEQETQQGQTVTALIPDNPGTGQQVVGQESTGQDQEFTGQESSGQESSGQESPGQESTGQSGFEDANQYLGGKGGGYYAKENDNEIDVDSQPRKPHKPWYKKVHGFLKNQYDYLKTRLGRGDDYYVNQ